MNKDWPVACVLIALIVAATVTINSCMRLELEGNMELMKEGIYGLTAQEASEVIHGQNSDDPSKDESPAK